MLSRRAYIIVFMGLEVLFMPVPFYLLALEFTAPCSYAFFVFIHLVPAWLFSLLLLAHLVCYLAVFYTLAWSSYWLALHAVTTRGGAILQALCLLAIFGTSFLDVIHGYAFVNATGTYNFWTACERFCK